MRLISIPHSPNNCDEQKGGLAYLLFSAYLVLKAENDKEKALPATKIYLLKNTAERFFVFLQRP